MDNIKKIRFLGIWIFVIPVVAVNLCLFIVTSGGFTFSQTVSNFVEPLGKIMPTFPYIDGGTSISRVARFFPTYLIFKPAIIFTGILLFYYWSFTASLFGKINGITTLKKYFKFFGVLSAIFLILHAVFLGIKFDFLAYKIFRRSILFFFIISQLTAQILFLINFMKIKNKIIQLYSDKILKIKIFIVSTMTITAIISAPIVTSSGNVYLKHGLEWNFFLIIFSFYLFSYWLWKKHKNSD